MRLYAVFYATATEGAVALVRAARDDAAKLIALREDFFPSYVNIRNLRAKLVPDDAKFVKVMTCGK